MYPNDSLDAALQPGDGAQSPPADAQPITLPPANDTAAPAVSPVSSALPPSPLAMEESEQKAPASRGIRVALPIAILIAVIALLVGGGVGYFVHTVITAPALESYAAMQSSATATAAKAASAAATATSVAATVVAQQPAQQPANMKELLALLVGKTRHFRGNANAPVTLLEFSDFQ